MSYDIGFRPTLDDVITAMSRKNYRIFNTPSRPFNLNIVGIRPRTRVPNQFDDWLTVFYRSNDQWIFNTFPATTDPGLYFLGDERMGTDRGTAILKPGQYRGAYELGKHQGRYRALVQAGGPVTVLRDFDRDEELDFDSDRTETGHFGINIHRANRDRASIQVDNWSAGCQVICDPLQFNHFLDLCEKGKQEWGNSFTYTLLTQDDLEPRERMSPLFRPVGN
jgi:hypothetical protein